MILPVSTFRECPSESKPLPRVPINGSTAHPFSHSRRSDSATRRQNDRSRSAAQFIHNNQNLRNFHYQSQSSSSAQIGRSSSSSSLPQASVTRRTSARRAALYYSANRASRASQAQVENFSLPADDRHLQEVDSVRLRMITYDYVQNSYELCFQLFSSGIGKQSWQNY